MRAGKHLVGGVTFLTLLVLAVLAVWPFFGAPWLDGSGDATPARPLASLAASSATCPGGAEWQEGMWRTSSAGPDQWLVAVEYSCPSTPSMAAGAWFVVQAGGRWYFPVNGVPVPINNAMDGVDPFGGR